MIRRAVPNDLNKITDYIFNNIKEEGFIKSRERIFSITRDCVASASNFAWLAEDENVNGIVLAITHGNLFYERNSSTIIYCDHEELFNKFMEWIKTRPSVNGVTFLKLKSKEVINGKFFQ